MFKKIIHFIKYHNAFAIALGLALFLTAVAFAGKDALIGEKKETSQGIDNSYVLSADFENFDFRLQIKKIEEDDENYYVSYSYQTVVIQDNAWQPVTKERTLTVSKKALGERDLGLLVAKELGETINYDWSYLKEVQKIEKGKGLTRKVVTTQYAGLVGKFLEPEEKVFPEYTPVVESEKLAEQSETRERIISYPGEPKPARVEAPTPTPTAEPVRQTINKEEIRQIVLELLAQRGTEGTTLADVGAGSPDVGAGYSDVGAGSSDVGAGSSSPEEEGEETSPLQPEPEPEFEPEPEPDVGAIQESPAEEPPADVGAGSSDVGAGSSDVGAGSSDVGAGSSDVGAGFSSPEEEGEETSPLQPEPEPLPLPETPAVETTSPAIEGTDT